MIRTDVLIATVIAALLTAGPRAQPNLQQINVEQIVAQKAVGRPGEEHYWSYV